MITHSLKTESEYFKAIENGIKNFELRKNDRDFKVGDRLNLQETINSEYTGAGMVKKVIYILEGGKFGLDPEYCIMQLADIP